MKTELLAEKTALVMQNKNGGFRDLYGSLSTVQWLITLFYIDMSLIVLVEVCRGLERL